MEQTRLDEETALKAAARKGWGFESLLLRVLPMNQFDKPAVLLSMSGTEIGIAAADESEAPAG